MQNGKTGALALILNRIADVERRLDDRLERIERALADIAADTDALHRTWHPHGDGEPLHRRRGRR